MADMSDVRILGMDELQEQLKTVTGQREQSQQMFHRLSGAMQILEGQIKSLQEKDDEDEANHKS